MESLAVGDEAGRSLERFRESRSFSAGRMSNLGLLALPRVVLGLVQLAVLVGVDHVEVADEVGHRGELGLIERLVVVLVDVLEHGEGDRRLGRPGVVLGLGELAVLVGVDLVVVTNEVLEVGELQAK